MTKFYRLAVVLALPLGAFAADPALLQMVMPDSQVVAGLQVNQAKGFALRPVRALAFVGE